MELMLFEFNNSNRAESKAREAFDVLQRINDAAQWVESTLSANIERPPILRDLKERQKTVYELYAKVHKDDYEIALPRFSFDRMQYRVRKQCLIIEFDSHSEHFEYDVALQIGGFISANYTDYVHCEDVEADWDFWRYNIVESWQAATAIRRIEALEKRIIDIKNQVNTKSYQKGYEDGRQEGYEDGYDDGYADGYKEGFEE